MELRGAREVDGINDLRLCGDVVGVRNVKRCKTPDGASPPSPQFQFLNRNSRFPCSAAPFSPQFQFFSSVLVTSTCRAVSQRFLQLLHPLPKCCDKANMEAIFQQPHQALLFPPPAKGRPRWGSGGSPIEGAGNQRAVPPTALRFGKQPRRPLWSPEGCPADRTGS